MDEYVKKALVGFDGNWFYEGYYQGKSYIAIIKKDNIVLFSNEAVSQLSKNYRDGYRTEVTIEELEELFRTKMYAIYKGNKYEVQRVRPRLEKVELLARKGYENEDLELGFEDDVYERITHKLVNKDEIEKIYVEKESVYKEFLEKYASK